MADIKTRESLHTVKTFDRVQNLAVKTRNGIDEAKQSINESIDTSAQNETEYAGNKIESTAKASSRISSKAFDKTGKWGVKETERNILELKNRKKTVKPKQIKVKQAQQKVKKSAKTAEKNAKTTKATVKTMKTAIKATVKFVKTAEKAIVAAVKATVSAIKSLVAAIVAGGWVAVVIILIVCIIGGAIAAIKNVFSSDEGGYSVGYMMSACMNEIRANETEVLNSTPHDYVQIYGDEPLPQDVISIYMVLTNNKKIDYANLTDKEQEKFREVFNTVYSVNYYTSQTEEIVVHQTVDELGDVTEWSETVNRTTLHIQRNLMTVWDAADYYGLDERQWEYLWVLISDATPNR